jgi:cell division protein FtsB
VLEKIKNYPQSNSFKQLQDIRAIGLIVFGLIVLLVTWSGIGAIETNYDLQKQASQLRQQNQLSELTNNNLQLQNQYYNTNEYLELQARELFGKGLPGEKLVLVPQSVAFADTVNLSAQTHTVVTSSPLKPAYQRNFEAWIDFFFHRNST